MTGEASRGEPGILPALVAVGAEGQLVLPQKIKLVAEDSPLPGGRAAMADLALGWEPGRAVAGVLRRFEILLVTGVTLGGRFPESILPVTVGAIECPVHAFKPESGHIRMIPLRLQDILPRLGCMAIPAVEAELELVAVILTPLPVAGLAGGRRAFEDPLEMTLAAGDSLVLADEGEICFVMVLGRPLGLLLLGGGARDPNQKPEAQKENQG
jgi:hypothetical protein